MHDMKDARFKAPLAHPKKSMPKAKDPSDDESDDEDLEKELQGMYNWRQKRSWKYFSMYITWNQSHLLCFFCYQDTMLILLLIKREKILFSIKIFLFNVIDTEETAEVEVFLIEWFALFRRMNDSCWEFLRIWFSVITNVLLNLNRSYSIYQHEWNAR